MKLEHKTVTINLSVYLLPPVDQILGFLAGMMQSDDSPSYDGVTFS